MTKIIIDYTFSLLFSLSSSLLSRVTMKYIIIRD